MIRGVRLAALALSLVLLFSGCKKPPDQEAVLAEQGHNLARQYGCISCHSSDGTSKIAPTWKRLYGSEVRLADGTTVTADEKYLRESILVPSAKTVKGYTEGLMETAIKPNSISEKDLRALIAYIKSLR